jgi:hypothetical protein
MEQRPPWELTISQLVKKFPAFYGTRKFITAFTTARHLSLYWASSIQSMFHLTSWRSILILSSHLRLGLPRGQLPSGLTTKILYALLVSPMRAAYPGHLILLDFITRIIFGNEYKSLSSSLCSLLRFPVASSLLGPNILLTPYSRTQRQSGKPQNTPEGIAGSIKLRLYGRWIVTWNRSLLILFIAATSSCDLDIIAVEHSLPRLYTGISSR